MIGFDDGSLHWNSHDGGTCLKRGTCDDSLSVRSFYGEGVNPVEVGDLLASEKFFRSSDFDCVSRKNVIDDKRSE